MKKYPCDRIEKTITAQLGTKRRESDGKELISIKYFGRIMYLRAFNSNGAARKASTCDTR